MLIDLPFLKVQVQSVIDLSLVGTYTQLPTSGDYRRFRRVTIATNVCKEKHFDLWLPLEESQEKLTSLYNEIYKNIETISWIEALAHKGEGLSLGAISFIEITNKVRVSFCDKTEQVYEKEQMLWVLGPVDSNPLQKEDKKAGNYGLNEKELTRKIFEFLVSPEARRRFVPPSPHAAKKECRVIKDGIRELFQRAYVYQARDERKKRVANSAKRRNYEKRL